MTINIADKLKSVIPDTIIDGKDASKTILVDTNENPIFMKNRAVLRTAEKRLDIHGDDGLFSYSIPLNDFDDSQILASIASINASITALESDVAEAGTTANNAKAQAELNKEDIVTLTTVANAADSLSKSNQSNLNELSTTVGGNAAAISANAKAIETNITAIASKTDQSSHDALVTAVGTKADQTSLDSVSATASAADTLSKANQGSISSINSTIGDIETEVLTTKQVAQKASDDVSALGSTVGNNSSQIANNTKNIGDNTLAIDGKASQTDLNAVSATATAADTLSKSNAGSITGLNTAVDNNTAAIATKASQTDLNSVSATATAADTLSKSNQGSIQNNATAISSKAEQSALDAVSTKADQNASAIATKADQSSLDTVAGVAGAADSRSQSNEAKLAGKVGTDSDASVNSLHVKTGNYNSDDNFDLKVKGTNVLSATQSALYAKKNIIFQGDNALIKGLSNAVENKDAMNKQSVVALTDALSTRIDSVAAGAGDESDFVTVDGFNKMVTEDGDNLLEKLTELDGDTQCHIAFNSIRASRPAINTGESRWVMYQFVNSDHPIWKFTPPDHVPVKDGLVCVEHTGDLGVSLRITTESTILVKTMHYHFGTGNNGRRNDWQVWQPRIKGYEGFNVGQTLTHDDIVWTPTSNPRTNMQRIRDAIPPGCSWIGWHNPNGDNKYKLVFHGQTSTIESTSGIVRIDKHGGSSSAGGIYINTASSNGEGWARLYLGASNGWASFGKQDNRSTDTRFENVDKITIPFYEDPPELNLFVIASFSDDLMQTKAVDSDGEYLSVGRYGVQWDGTWTRDEAYHTAYYRQASNTYIAYDYGEFKWRKFTAAKQHTFISQPAVANSIALFGARSQFPVEGSVYVQFGDLDTLPYEQISQPTIVHDNVAKTSTINFGAARWGYIEGGGVPDTSGDYPGDGYDPIPEIEE